MGNKLSSVSSERQQQQQQQQMDSGGQVPLSQCPVPTSSRNSSKCIAVYNVYNQPIQEEEKEKLPHENLLDPRNNMPLAANQKPCPGQKELLSTDRVQSNIPKGGTDATWLYPSPQMFYNGGFFLAECVRV